jgi:hypothetical protein
MNKQATPRADNIHNVWQVQGSVGKVNVHKGLPRGLVRPCAEDKELRPWVPGQLEAVKHLPGAAECAEKRRDVEGQPIVAVVLDELLLSDAELERDVCIVARRVRGAAARDVVVDAKVFAALALGKEMIGSGTCGCNSHQRPTLRQGRGRSVPSRSSPRG